MPNTDRHKDDGFSVLEAMVAIAILAAGLLPLLALQGQFVKTVTRIEQAEQSLSAQDNALGLMHTVNLTETPKGEVVFEGYIINYEAKAAILPAPIRDVSGLPGRYDLTLYDVVLKISYDSGAEEEFSIKAFGWREISSIIDSL